MTYAEMAERVSALLNERLGVRGRGLEARLRRAGRLLPRDVRRHASLLAEAARDEANPRLARRFDPAGVRRAFDICESYLNGIDRWDRRLGAAVGFGASVALGLVALGIAALVVLRWRGYL